MHWLTLRMLVVGMPLMELSGTGAVYQGRFKAIPIQSDGHFLTVWRYVERNPLRANLVSDAADWHWSSLSRRRKMLCER